jgi:transposase
MPCRGRALRARVIQRTVMPRMALARGWLSQRVTRQNGWPAGSRQACQRTCRVHAVLCDLVPGGHSKEISAAQAARILEQGTPSGAVARAELAAEFLEDMRRLDTQLRDTRKKLAAAVRASGTTLTDVFGAGPVVVGIIIGDVAEVSRFPRRDHFAAYNGTAPAGVASGNRKVYQLSLRGNRRVNHAMHMVAITQIRHRHSDGRAYYEKKLAEGKTHKEALRSGARWERSWPDSFPLVGMSIREMVGTAGFESATP